MDADVIVVGGGPAGAMAAYQLAPHASVLVLERRQLPRDKPCSGVLTQKSLWMLADAIDLDSVFCGWFAETRIGTGRLHQVHRHAPLWIANRSRMDFSLLTAAARRGARVEEDMKVRVVNPGTGQVELASGRTLQARIIVGADGAMGVTSRAVNGNLPAHAVAMEARIEDPRPLAKRRAVIDFSVPRGYFWAFPHAGQELAVGGGSAEGRTFGQLRRKLSRWAVEEFGVDLPRASLHAHFVPCMGVARRVAGKTMLVGDAAGLVDPLLGEGIAYALWSGALAARVCSDQLRGLAPLTWYDQLIRAHIEVFQRPLRIAARLPSAGTALALAVQATRVRRLGWRKVVERWPDDLRADLQMSSIQADAGSGFLAIGGGGTGSQ